MKFISKKILKDNNKKLIEQCSKVSAENVNYQKQIKILEADNIELAAMISERDKEIKRLKTLCTKNGVKYKKEDKNGRK